MQALSPSVVIGLLMLIAARPEAVAQSNLSNTYIHLADNSVPQDQQGRYVKDMKNDMHDWQNRLQRFDAKVDNRGHAAATGAENDLRSAWTQTETEAHKLQTAGAQDWDSAKVAYENASHRLAAAWDRIGSGDK